MLPRPIPSTSDWTKSYGAHRCAVLARRSGRTGPRGRPARGPAPRGRCARCAAGSRDRRARAPGGRSARRRGACGRARRRSTSRSNTTSTMIGASPSVGSSSRTSRGIGHQGPGDGELLGLAARQVAGRRRPAVGEHGEAVPRLVEAAAAVGTGVAVTPASCRFSPTVRSRKIRRCSGTSASPARTRRAGSAPVTSTPSRQHPPRRRADQPGDRVEQRRLAGAVGSDEGDELAGTDVDRHVVERDDGAVARGQPLDGAASGRDVRRAEGLGERRRAVLDGEDDDVLLRARRWCRRTSPSPS